MKTVVSNMTGTVLEVLVAPGDTIDDGQDVVLLESMKMQMMVPADASGKVAEVKVDVGDFVNEGDALLVLE